MASIHLRPVDLADLGVLFGHQDDPEANRMAAFPPRDWPAFEAHWRKVLLDPGVLVRIIEVDGQVAGHVSTFPVDGDRHVGYWLGREHWGKGIATSALAQFLTLVPERPLHARVAKENAGSIRVLEKCGFSAVGERDDDGVLEVLYLLR